MARSSFLGYLRQYGSNGKTATPSVGLQCVQMTVPATQTASASIGKTLPMGSIPLFVQNIDGAATAGTIDIGTSTDANGFAEALPANAKGGLVDNSGVTGGLLLGDTLASDSLLYATATGVDIDTIVSIYYIMVDDGKA